jgi:hypothetical protein
MRAGRAGTTQGAGRGAAAGKEGGTAWGKLPAGAENVGGIPSAARVGWRTVPGASRAGAHNFRSPCGTLRSPETCRAPLLDPPGRLRMGGRPPIVAAGPLRGLRPGWEPSAVGVCGDLR